MAGPPGPQGAKGDTGSKGDAGDDGKLSLRIVRGHGPSATCNAEEVMISAFCTGKYTRNPLVTTQNGAKCGPDAKNNPLEVTIVCARM